tara:strand:+ start:591 stop:1058 length:468 start_codon:yes stop_codon:yes gene_type:complete
MPRKSSKKMRSRRKGCSNAPKRNCNSRKNCRWKKSRGCRRRSHSRISKYEKVYRSVVTKSKRTSTKKRSRKPSASKLNSYTRFVKANINDMTATTQAGRMKQVAKLWKKTHKSPSNGCKNGRKLNGKCRKSPCRRGLRRKSRVCKRKPGPKSRSR